MALAHVKNVDYGVLWMFAWGIRGILGINVQEDHFWRFGDDLFFLYLVENICSRMLVHTDRKGMGVHDVLVSYECSYDS